jgi:ribonucleoside-diphosphate reductase alpha chain
MTTMTPYQQYIHTSRYARWREADNRRESWDETVDRYIAFFKAHLVKYGVDPKDEVFANVREAIFNLDVLPSMRALMTAGPALERSHMAGYNCSYISVDHPRAFDEILWILANGTGVGFGVERSSVEMLPSIPNRMTKTAEVVVVEDSREGWASAYRALIENLYMGYVPSFDVSAVRPAGARLKTFGGRASGPGPLLDLFTFTIDTFTAAQGRRLSPLEVHDIVCKIGEVIVSGGVRRSALISLSDVSNYEMAKAKSGSWWESNGQRALANNSAIYDYKPTPELFLREWGNLIESQSGERGLFNREGVRNAVPARRRGDLIAGTNPCGEIALRSMGLCNLTDVVIRPNDSEADIRHKVRIAAIIGTWQSTLTEFGYVRPGWRENAEDERLLGVGLTGIYGNRLFNNPLDQRLPLRLESLRNSAVLMNGEWAKRLGIKAAAAVTTIKPSGTVSQLTGVSSGIHPWHSKFYIRTVRGANTDPLVQLMKDSGVPHEPDVMAPDKTTVFSFPIAAPKHAVTRAEVSALDHLALYKVYREHWAEHTVSITVNVKPEEWVAVAAWVYDNWNSLAGVSFLPYSEHTYQQAPYTEVSADEYATAVASFPAAVRYADLSFYEHEDGTIGARELACSADTGCEVVDLV